MGSASIVGAALASAAIVSAQVTYQNGTWVCPQANAAYCAGDSLGTDIIIRCNGNVGHPGRCSDNLAGEPPVGNLPALCWQTSPTSGDAACEKNCVVYGGSGNYGGTFTLPASVCTPTYTASSSASSAISSTSPSGASSTTSSSTTSSSTTSSSTTSSSTTSSSTTSSSSSSATATSSSSTSSSCSTASVTPSSSVTVTIVTVSSATSAASASSNSTVTLTSTSTVNTYPTGPSSGPATGTGTLTGTVPVHTAGAVQTGAAGAGLAVVGAFFAFLL